MKRDMDLVRRILLEVEEKASSPAGWLDLAINGYSADVVSYHVRLLKEAELLDAVDLSSGTETYDVRPRSLTWKGHEFLDAARSDALWAKVKFQVKEKVASVSFDIIKALLLRSAAEMFGLPSP